MARFVLCRAKESGRTWVYLRVVWEAMEFEYQKNPKHRHSVTFEVIAENDNAEVLNQMSRLANHDMNQEMADDLRKEKS